MASGSMPGVLPLLLLLLLLLLLRGRLPAAP
jgi:uncharacterized protein (TIGR03382 family)